MRNATSPVFFFDREKVLLRIKIFCRKTSNFLLRPLKMGRNFVFGYVWIFLFLLLFSMENQLPEIMIELSDFLLMPNQL